MELISKGSFLLIAIISKLTPLCCDISNFKYNFNDDLSSIEIQQREIASQNKEYVRKHAGLLIYPHFNTILSSVLDLMAHWNLEAVTLLTDDTYFESDSSKLSVVRWFQSRGIHLILKLIHSLNDSEIMSIKDILSEDRDVIIMCQTNHTDDLISLGNQALVFRNWFIVQSDIPRVFKKMTSGRNQFVLVSQNYFGKSYETLLNTDIGIHNIFFVYTLKRWKMTKFASWSFNKRLNLLSDFDQHDANTKLKQITIRFVMQNERSCQYVYWAFHLISKLLNFSIFCVASDTESYGIETNGTFDGMIGVIQRKEADITGVGLVMQQNRARVARFVAPVMFSTLSIWYRPASPTVSPIAHLRVFSWPTWICAFAAVITMACILSVALFNINTEMDEKFMHFKKWIFNGQIILDIFNNMPGLSNKLLAGVFYLWVLAMFAHYSSVLKSFLIHKQQETIFRSLKDVADRKDYRVLLVKGAVLNDYFKLAGNPIHQDISQRVQSSPDNLVGPSGGSNFLCEEKAVLIELNRYMDILLSGVNKGAKNGPPCELVNKPQAHFKTLTHLAFRKDFPYENIFRNRFLKVFEGGVYNREVQQRHNKKDAAQDNLALSLFYMTVPLIILATGIMCASLALIIETFLHRRHAVMKSHFNTF